MKATTFYLNIRRFNALLPLIAILLMAVALALGVLFTDTSPPPKSVIAPDKKESASGDALEFRKLDVEMDLGPKFLMGKQIKHLVSGSSF
jgi:hypothetical protein